MYVITTTIRHDRATVKAASVTPQLSSPILTAGAHTAPHGRMAADPGRTVHTSISVPQPSPQSATVRRTGYRNHVLAHA